MRQFVEECRREWKRLGVPDPVANEMAADLEADLDEAEAEGVSAEAVLGSSAFDPPAFAAAWASERGVVHAPPVVIAAATTPAPSRLPAAFALFAGIAVVGALLALLSTQFPSPRLALNGSPVGPTIRTIAPVPSLPGVPRVTIVRPHRLVGPVEVVGSDSSRIVVRGIGLILLVGGALGLVASLVHRSRRPVQ